MSERSHDRIVVGAFEPLAKGERFSRWPLHVTIQPWYAAPTYESAFFNAVQNYLYDPRKPVRPLVAEPVEDAWFGSHEKVKVKLLRDTGVRFNQLHTGLGDLILRFGGQLATEHVGNDYRPHVTYHADGALEEPTELEALYFIHRENNENVVDRVYHLRRDR